MIIQTAKQVGILGKLIMAGFQGDTSPFYCLMDVLCIASQREGFGLVAAEAMFHKLSVIATNVEAVEEIIKDGINGWIIEPVRKEELYEKIRYIIDLNTKRKKNRKRSSRIFFRKPYKAIDETL
ncbi:N-acetyl-alpha-D-glucosaminyl L-malate synthase [termite gut metagenome]|uniref:N-acetyl-alpha-D-glucosaminyl L-malate synthase n=1 Tax=termite gut metagenome TaxID=433724 RepID=A0A5J4QN37_9ZZZZ